MSFFFKSSEAVENAASWISSIRSNVAMALCLNKTFIPNSPFAYFSITVLSLLICFVTCSRLSSNSFRVSLSNDW